MKRGLKAKHAAIGMRQKREHHLKQKRRGISIPRMVESRAQIALVGKQR